MTKPSYKDLFDVHKKYIELALAQSGVTHQVLKNVKSSGDEVEKSINHLLRLFVPDRFKIVSGYIVKAESWESEPIISTQLDTIIVDTLVPHQLFHFGTEEIHQAVPFEAVVGIFEIKRTLNKREVKRAYDHLCVNVDRLGISKTNSERVLPGGVGLKGFGGGLHTNPLIGILGLSAPRIKIKDRPKWLESWMEKPILDIMASMDGFTMVTSKPRPDGNDDVWFRHHQENESQKIKYLFPDGVVGCDGENLISAHLALTFGFITTYLSLAAGRNLNFGHYFLNKNLWRD
jgi:hypothetical protein